MRPGTTIALTLLLGALLLAFTLQIVFKVGQ
jgi:hypothetical protein